MRCGVPCDGNVTCSHVSRPAGTSFPVNWMTLPRLTVPKLARPRHVPAAGVASWHSQPSAARALTSNHVESQAPISQAPLEHVPDAFGGSHAVPFGACAYAHPPVVGSQMPSR